MKNPYDWQSLLVSTVYDTFPEAAEKPVIGITANYGEQLSKLAEGYYKSVVRAGGVPVIIPPLSDTDSIINTLERIDALVLSGGSDYDPHYAGEEPSPLLGATCPNCSSPVWPTTANCPSSASAAAFRHWPWHWAVMWHRT